MLFIIILWYFCKNILLIAGIAVFAAVYLNNGTNANAKNSDNIVDYNIEAIASLL